MRSAPPLPAGNPTPQMPAQPQGETMKVLARRQGLSRRRASGVMFWQASNLPDSIAQEIGRTAETVPALHRPQSMDLRAVVSGDLL